MSDIEQGWQSALDEVLKRTDQLPNAYDAITKEKRWISWQSFQDLIKELQEGGSGRFNKE